jgi:hypothetical protein
MQSVKQELDAIKASLHQNQNSYKKEIDELKQENLQLKAKIQEITLENTALKCKAHQTETITTVGESKYSNLEIKPLTLAKESRRQKYAQDYESISFVPSAACILCTQKDQELA